MAAEGARPTPGVGDVLVVADQIRSGSRRALSRAITLCESTRPEHQEWLGELLTVLGEPATMTVRLGISGVPGAGKSTFINRLGVDLVDGGHRVAVLAIDPSSTRTGGSILGDRTRMADLAVKSEAFIRPSPTSGHLGGVARATREAMALVEAAGFDVVIVETVGVGQSEVAVADMVDTFLLLALARSGDSLQGIKRGVLELADVVAINKCDGPHEAAGKAAASELRGALRLLRANDATPPEVTTCSALDGTGVTDLWQLISGRHEQGVASGELVRLRADQRVRWMWAAAEAAVVDRFRHDPAVVDCAAALHDDLRAGKIPVTVAVRNLLDHHP